MARTLTLLELRTQVRQRGDYENSDVFTDAILTAWVNDAIAEVYQLLVQSDQLYYTIDTTLTATPGSDSIPLPADFYKLDGLDLRLGSSQFVPLPAHSIAERNAYGQRTGRPVSYRVQANQIRLMPIPSSAETLRLAYTPCAAKLVSDSDTFDGINGWEHLLIAKVLLLCDEREERPLGDRMARIQALEAEVRTAADARNTSEPVYLDGGAGRMGGTSWL